MISTSASSLQIGNTLLETLVFLLARGFRVQQARVREAFRRTDTDGVLLRSLQLRTIARRRHNVKSPLSLWHPDGHRLSLESCVGIFG